MIINPNSVSFEDIYKDLDNFVKSQSDFAKWKDRYMSSTGTIEMQLIAGLGAFLQFLAVVNRREGFLMHAENRSSLNGLAESLGYSTFRGQNIHLRLSVTPNGNVAYSKFDSIGSYKQYDVVLLDNATFAIDTPTTIDVVIGEKKNAELEIDTDNPALFRFDVPEVSEDFELSLFDGVTTTELNTSSRIVEILDGKYAVLTNALGSIDILYDNSTGTTYNIGDKFILDYIKLESFDVDSNSISLDSADITAVELISEFQSRETKDMIRINAPIYHETEFVVRGRNDYRKILQTLVPNAVDANGRDISPAVVELTYVTATEELLTDIQKEQLIQDLEPYRPFGVEPPSTAEGGSGITDPVKVEADLFITVYLSTNNVVTSDVKADIIGIINKYEKKLQNGKGKKNLDGDYINSALLDTAQIEHEIERFDYVKIARVSLSNRSSEPALKEYDEEALSPTGNEVGNDGWTVYINGTGTGTFDGYENVFAIWNDTESTWNFDYDIRERDTHLDWNEYFSFRNKSDNIYLNM